MMSSRVDELRRARARHAVAWVEFQHAHARESNGLFCFYEGYEDIQYYRARIVNRLGLSTSDEPLDFVCNGKKGVLRLRELTRDTRFSGARLAFFVDADFDDNADVSALDDVYITPCYSIENFFVSPDVMRRILRAEFRFPEGVGTVETVEGLVVCFRDRMNEFLAATAALNEWIFHARRDNTELNLDDLKLLDLIDFRSVPMRVQYSLESSVLHGRVLPNFSPCGGTCSIQRLEHERRWATFRGKYLFEYMLYFVRELAGRRGPCSNLLPPKTRTVLTISDASALLTLSSYADTPACLTDFIDRLARPHKPARDDSGGDSSDSLSRDVDALVPSSM